MKIRLSTLLLLAVAGSAAASPPPAGSAPLGWRTLDLAHSPRLQSRLPRLAARRVVFVGENHDSYPDHLVELALIRAFYARHPDLAIGMEFFQQPFQPALDAYIAGQIDEAQMLRRTQYFRRWGYDYRYYRPIMRFARTHRIPVIALNLPGEITAKVGRHGMGSVTPKERVAIPRSIDRSDDAYRRRLLRIFSNHPHHRGADFANFLDVQLLWDEGMAARAAKYLETHPGSHMVILAGAGHLQYGAGIPNRLKRRLPASSAIVLNARENPLDPMVADLLTLPEPRRLPAPGRLGLTLGDEHGKVVVERLAGGGAAQEAGVLRGDRLLAIDGWAIATSDDVRIALLGRRPGQRMTLKVRRGNWFSGMQDKTFELTLQ